MPLLNWSENLSVSSLELDTQHKRLIGMLNDLNDAMTKGQGREMLKPLLAGLVQYTASHFANEERYMQRFNYPDFAEHKREHDTLTQQVLELKGRFDKGQTMLTLEVMRFLKSWLTTHIMGTDKKYVPCFAQNGLK